MPSAGDLRFGGVRTPSGYEFELTGGRLCLDFANTKDQRLGEEPRELLNRYEDVLDWGVQAGALSRAEAQRLREHAAAHPIAAANALARAVEAREIIFDILSAIARARPVPSALLDALKSLVADTVEKRRLERTRGGFEWRWRETDTPDFDRVLWPVVWSAAELLTSTVLDRARQCEGPGCAWLFMDTSKNRRKRWCDMSVCGNRAKARRYQERQRAIAQKGAAAVRKEHE